MATPSLVKGVTDLSVEESRSISELQAHLSQDESVVRRFNTHDWLKLAWCRSLDSGKAVEVLKTHRDYINKWNLNEIPLHTVRENFKAGFSVIAGRDFDGRPMLWQRMQFMTPATIPLDVGIKSTWLALDAALSDLDSNRVGVCLIYDFANVGMRNVSLNLLDVRDGSLACGAGHPSHITRVIFLNAPFMFRMAFNAAKPLLPTSVSSVVQMINASTDGWFQDLCPKSELPEYLGGQQTGDYFSWLSTRLDGTNLLYHPEPINTLKTPTDNSETSEQSLIGQ
jgi:hypothetical protein